MRRTGATARVLMAVAATLGCGACGAAETAKIGTLQLLETHPLSIREPSGLTINESGTALWVVTNNPDSVFQLDLKGNPVKTLDFVGEDLEGIEYDPSDKTLWVVEENRREIVHLDLQGKVLSRHPLGLVGKKNSGLEGICLDDQGRMFALNEKNPGLFLELKADLSIAGQHPLDFAKDYSGLAYNREAKSFWIVSDQEQKLYLWSTRSGVLDEYPLPFPKAEGIAIDAAANRIYIVSDSENSLYVYQTTRQ